MKKILLAIVLFLLPGIVFAANVTVPQSTAFGQILRGNASNGNYTPVATSTLNIDLSDVTGILSGSKGGTGQSSYSVGDILYASGATTLSKLNIGSSGYILTVNGGIPIWLPAGQPNSKWATGTPATFITPNTSGVGIDVYASSTISNLTIINSTTTNATTTSLYASATSTFPAGISADHLKAVDSGGVDIFSINGTRAALFGAGGGSGTTLDGGVNIGGLLNVLSALTTLLNLQVNSSTTLQNFTGVNATTSNATSTSFFATTASTTNLFGSGLSSCNGSNFLQWSTGLFSCGTPAGSTSWSTTSQDYYNSQFRDWKIFSSTYLAPTTTWPILINNSTSTITNLQVVNGTTTNATSTNLYVSSILGIATTTPSKNFSVQRIFTSPVCSLISSFLEGNFFLNPPVA